MADPDGMKELGGAASAFIAMMASAILALAGAVTVQWKQSSKVYGFRLKERDDLRDALNGATKAQEAATKVAEERNRVVAELADAIRDQTSTFEKLLQRIDFQYENQREQTRDHHRSLDDQVKVIGEMAGSIRNLDGSIREVRNKLIKDGVI